MSARSAVAGLLAAVEAGQTILAPNTELAAALFDAVERAYRDAGREVWRTPRVRDFNGWLREQHAQRQLDDATLPRILSDIEERELWRSVIGASESGRELLEPTGAVRAARRARRAVNDYRIPLPAVELHASASDESRAFLDWNHEFDQRLRALDCLGVDDLLLRASTPAAPITWIESPVWRPTARQWLERNGPMLLPPASAMQRISLQHSTSPATEMAAMADWALANLKSDENFRAWVYVPDLTQRRAEVVDAMDAALAPQRFTLSSGAVPAPYAVAGGTALADFAPVRAAMHTLTATWGSVPFENFSKLLRAPELHASLTEAAAASRLDIQVRRRGLAEADLAGWLALAERCARAQGIATIPALQRLQSGLRALQELRGDHPMSRWVAAWVRSFELAPWALRHRWSSSEYQSAERFRELLAALATSDSFFGVQSSLAAQRILLRATRDTAFQVQTGVPPVWVSGQLIDPWLSYRGLWISGCSAERWPPAVDPIALLPVRLQRDYGVIAAAAESQLQSAVDLQDRWVARAAHCVFSYADSVDGRRAAASPLVPAGTRPLTPAANAVPQPHWHALRGAAPALERLFDELAPPFGAGERTRGVSTLRAQSRCAFRGFAETRLRTDRLERPMPGFNERERGELLHDALEYIWSVLRDSSALLLLAPQVQSELLEDAVGHALTRACRVRDPGPRWRRRERERMRGVLSKWLDVERRRQPFQVEDLERGSEHAHHGGLDFSVRIDRVDRLADGARVLIDYKSGSAGADWRGERPDNPQLPIYALLRPQALVAVAYGKVNAGECTFVAETERADIFKPGGRKSSLEGRASFGALIDDWSKRIEKLAADFSIGHAAVAPTLRACKSCWLHGLCRVPGSLEDGAAANG